MKQLLILSGKGGTGKTTVAGAFIRLSEAKAYADCDVDAPNLHLVTAQAQEARRRAYYGLPKAEIDESKCLRCGLCREACRFRAISLEYRVDTFACEGCGVCEVVCPAQAIALKPAQAGELMLYAEGDRVFSTAELGMGSGTSGMLVTEVKRQMQEASGQGSQLAVIDGSPGIGCPVIASLSGVDMVLIVAEPSISGISDMERIVRTAQRFQTKIGVCTNKYDTNLVNAQKIEDFCRERGLPFVGRIPFDPEAVKSVNRGETIVDVPCPSGSAVKEIFRNTLKFLFPEDAGTSHENWGLPEEAMEP